jgi:tRNA nucleotidyltransferase (CCA-adding enzyme)
MDLILCHQTADFDAVGAAVGLTRLKIGSKFVLTGGAHPAVRDFLALHRDEFSVIERRSVNPKKIRHLIVVDTQYRERLGKAAEWFDLDHLSSIELYDHHLNINSDIPATFKQIEAVGATTTLIVEKLQQAKINLTSFEATAMALGIHVDTGSLTFDQSTPRDAHALAWLMEQGANIKIIAEYIEPSLSPQLQQLLTEALENLQITKIQGYTIGSVLLITENFIPGLSNLVARLIDLTEIDALLVGHHYTRNRGDDHSQKEARLTIIGRSRIEQTNLHLLFNQYGGGGHSQAASVTLKGVDTKATLNQFLELFKQQIPHPLTARDLMSSPVRTIRPHTTIEEAQRILFRYGHSGLSVVNKNGELMGIISRRDIDLALHHGFSHAPVKGYMTRNLKTIFPETTLPEIEDLMVNYDVGRLPVLDGDQLIGIVTRTDVLRELHQAREEKIDRNGKKLLLTSCLLPSIKDRIASSIWQLLETASKFAQKRGWHLYLVGGAVRDILLTEETDQLLLQDIDLVVDGFHRSADVGAGVELANLLQENYPQSRLSIHGAFQTAALLWHKDADFGSLWVDIATARTEFYPYPAANPEVEASSIRQDLYRRDFTINALAVRLTEPRAGELLDFFGGLLDLRSHQIKVLHANSFIEDPTRIFRAVRFAVRLNFEIEPQTRGYIGYALESGVYDRLKLSNAQTPALTTRLKSELKYIFQAAYWKPALQLLGSLEALRCLHPDLKLSDELWWQIRCVDRWLRWLDPQRNLDHWLIRLEILLIHLEHSERIKVGQHLQLPKDSIQRLSQFSELREIVVNKISKDQKRSAIFDLLKPYKLGNLILLAVTVSKSIRKILWQYLAHWSKIKAPLNGDDLKALGYQPGPKFKEILDQLLIATLDGLINNREEAKIYLETKLINSEK